MSNKPFLLILFLCLSISTNAQDFNNYQLLKSTGKIPKDFLIPSSEKYKKELENVDKNNNQKDQKQFYLESNFLIDDLLQSAKVLFNDPITAYVNKVADELLKDDEEMRQKLRFYAVRSSAVNAFATNQGIIFVNVGLLAQLESEAQLAFILAHEISHVRHGHALDMYLEAQKISRYSSRTDLMRNTSFDDRIVAKNYFSKELETHADKEGLDLYLTSKYSLEDLDGVFDVLQYSYLPFDIIPFKRAFFESEFITFPESYFLPEEELNEINGSYEEDDSKSTHPSIDKRRTACSEIIANNSNANRSAFVTGSKEDFLKVRDIARFELAYYYLHDFRYQDAIYACYILQQKYPNSLYLKKIITKSLYGYTKFKNELKGVKPYSVSYSDEDISSDYMSKNAHEDIEGPSQQVYYFLAQLEPKDLTVFTLRYAWDVVQEYADDKELQTILEDLFLELAYHYEKRSEFSTQSILELSMAKLAKAKQDSLDKIQPKTPENTTKLSKYDKIKKQKKEQEIISEEEIDSTEYSKYAFRDVLESKMFKNLFSKGQKEKQDREARTEYFNSSEGRAELRKRRKNRMVALGIDSVLVYSPYYVKIIEGRKSKVDHLKSEKNQLQLTDILVKNAELAKVNITLLNTNNLNESDAEAFNELRILSEWMSQQNRFGGNLLMKGFDQDYADKIVQKYGTPYLLFTGIASIQRSKTHWVYWSVLFDLETGRYQVIKEDYYKQKDTKTQLNAHIFDTFFQIKSKRKKRS
ncbi:M48 family metallopeptidase [Aureispira anguillae]|uniref:M48 family metallopeptidase n=1 Tax=Aureispira anguillae TaxID=2864201 RepID=A0A915YI66_9BACT|nr:M48 family metallopeptidase [Aureispira anguillae]BDS13634.1 M48 family metallopeptidase [Aureispira anguillae]